MIESFGDSETQRIWKGNRSRKLPGNIQERARTKLRMIDAAMGIKDLLAPPSNRLERLKGKRKDERSIRINDQWRISFRWENGNAKDVKIEDYHD